MLDKEKVKELYLKGYNAVQIAVTLKCKDSAVRKCISRNFKEFKTSNIAEKIRQKEVKRITLHESKQYMSDADFIKRNRSIYKTNKDGDIVLDKSVAPVVSFDTPRRFKNEYSEKEVDKRIVKSPYKKSLLFNC